MVKLANEEQSQVKRATRAAYGATLAELANEGLPVVAVDADLTGSTTTKKLADAGFADRLFNCGIAEQNMVDVAAGLAATGHIAYTGSFAVFGTGRAYDQIRNTVCYSNLDVKIAPTHAGISVGPDGGSHQMLEDVSLMRGLPNMRVLVPADYAAARAAIRLAAETPGPVYVRMGRASVPAVYADGVELELGRAYVLREGSDATIVACGVEVEQALKAAQMLAAEGVEVEVIDAFSVKPLDEDTVLASVGKTGRAVVAEEHSVYGGLGSAVAETLARSNPAPVEFVGMRDQFGKSGEFEELLARVRRRIPDATLRTTLIAGFPGETDGQFEELCAFVEDAGFDYVGVFPYSREEGTRAFDLPGQVDEDEKADRAQRLRDVADAVCAPRVAERIGRTLDVLVEGREEDGQLFGRAMCQAPEVDGVTYLEDGEVGQVVRVTIGDTLLYEMEGA